MLQRHVRYLLCGCGLVLLFWGTPGCGDQSCENARTECGDYRICCTETNCYYEADDGTRFDCDGIDCEEAAQELAEYQCDVPKDEAPEGFERLVEQMVAEAREQATAARTGH